jgi:tryptophan synthase beta subunit
MAMTRATDTPLRILVNLSGRGDKDLETVMRQGARELAS